MQPIKHAGEHLRRRGFTLIESMVAILSGSILALVVGSMLVAGYSGWRFNTNRVNRQRDASLAMETIGRHIRESGMQDIRIDGVSYSPSASGSSLDFAANLVRSNAVHIAVNGDALVLDPGNFNLVRSGVQNVFAEFNPRGPRIHVILQLFDPELGLMIMEGSYRPRNDVD